MEDPGIKLFGKKIVLPETSKSIDLPVISTAGEEPSGGGDNKDGGFDQNHGLLKSCSEGKRVNIEDAEEDQLKAKQSEIKAEGTSSPKAMAESDNPKTPSIEEETRTEKSEGDATNPQPKTLKKPDKILPCPRCTSMDTKFCYYNNYNVNQPRHFCKSCQRYWTAGGAMRNMPVGAGRRKNKNSAAHCRYVTISQEAFQAATAAAQNEVAATSDRVHSVSGGSTVTTSDSGVENFQDQNGFHSGVHCIPGVSWSYNPWNSAIPIPAICPPMPIYPSTYWNCIPLLPPLTPAQSRTFQPSDPMLGKHSRDGVLIKPNHSDEEPKKSKHSSVLIPKTLRIDDPDEAAKSSIWATLGIKNENFKAFQEKGEETKKHPATTTSPVLQANPAALSRSLCFQESA